jgi:hypothetical protein
MIHPQISHLFTFAFIAGLGILIPFSGFIGPAEAQRVPESNTSIVAQIPQSPNVQIVVGTLYGINSTIGKVVVFATIGGATNGKIFDAALADSQDNIKDGIAEIGLVFANMTIQSGTKFRACAIVLNTLQIECATGHKSPSQRAEFIDLVLNDNDTKIPQEITPTIKTKNPIQ